MNNKLNFYITKFNQMEFNILKKILIKKVYILCSPENFLFSCNENLQQVMTTIEISKERNRVVSVGEPFIDTIKNECINLFDLNLQIDEEEYLLYLQSYLLYFTRKVAKNLLIKPIVIICESDSLPNNFNTSQKELLRKALLNLEIDNSIFIDK